MLDKREIWGLRIEDGGFLLLVLLVTLGFAWLLLPFFGAILWGVVAAIVFAPLNRRLVGSFGGRRSLAAAATLLIILALVIIPAILLGISLVQEAAVIYAKVQGGQIDFLPVLAGLRDALPRWAQTMLDSSGLTDLEGARRTLGSSVASWLQSVASQALVFGQGALRFLAALGIMLYLSFFLLRDGDSIGRQVKSAMPLRPAMRDALMEHFVVVVRATMKGTVVVAVLQGIVGGVIFWLLGVQGALLWGLLMGFFSLVPAVGTGIVWVPVAIYLLATGQVWQGLVLTGAGIFVIGLIDNLLRPVLVGKDTRMPDFVVLIATLAGLELFGLNGFIVGPTIAALFIAVWKIIAEGRQPAILLDDQG